MGKMLFHMLTGKAYDRAVRAHLLTESALYTLLMRHIFSEAASGESGYLAEYRNLYRLSSR